MPVKEVVKEPLISWNKSLALGIYSACLEEVGRLKEAEQVLNKVLALQFGDAETKASILIARGSIRWRQGRIFEAIADYENAYKQEPSYWRILVKAYIKAGKRDKAMEVVKEMANLDKFAQYVFNRKGQAVWLGIYRARSPFFISGRWVKNSGIKGNWAVNPSISRHSRNWVISKDALVFAVNGKTFKNE